MKVLYLIDALAFGGAENTLLTLMRNAEHGDFDAEVAVLASESTTHARWLPLFRNHGIKPRFLGIERVRQLNALPRVAAEIHRSGADVVHAHLGTASLLAPPAARITGRHAVCTLHTMARDTDRSTLRRERLSVASASRSHRLIFVSHASLDSFAKRYRKNDATWTVVHNGVDIDTFRPGDGRQVRESLGIPAGAPVAAQVGALRAGKGYEVTLRAWRQVVQCHPDAHLVLVGDGPDADALRREAAEAGVEHRVVFTGMRTDVDEVLRGCDLLLHPTARDALPTVLIEAAASGVPVVASDVDGVPEIVVPGETGWLLDTVTVESLASAVYEAFADRTALALRGDAARQHAVKHFDARHWAGRMSELYQEAA